jgi:hypothetical protein
MVGETAEFAHLEVPDFQPYDDNSIQDAINEYKTATHNMITFSFPDRLKQYLRCFISVNAVPTVNKSKCKKYMFAILMNHPIYPDFDVTHAIENEAAWLPFNEELVELKQQFMASGLTRYIDNEQLKIHVAALPPFIRKFHQYVCTHGKYLFMIMCSSLHM